MTTITAGTSIALAAKPKATERQHESWKTGLALAGVAGIASMQRTLMTRPLLHQAGITVPSMALYFGAGVAADVIAKGVERGTGADEMTSRVAIAGVGAAGVLATTIALRGRSSIVLSGIRSGIGLIGGGALVGAGLVAEQRAVDAVQDKVPGGAIAAHAAILGAAALAAGTLMLATVRPSAVSKAGEAAQNAIRAGLEKAPAAPPVYDAAFNATIAAQRTGMTTISGIAKGSLLPYDTAGVQGQRFLREGTPRAEIARIMGVKAEDITSPFRIYGGMDHAATHEELVDKVVAEAGALRNEAGKTALDAKTVIIYIPSGTGYITPPPVQAAELAGLGDVTSIGLQYWNKPSVQSMGRVPDAAELTKIGIAKIVKAVRERPGGADTKIVVYGESLGSWTTQAALGSKDANTVAKHGLDLVVNAGTPRFSPFRTAHLGIGGHATDPTGTITEIDNVTELPQLGTAARDKLQAVLVSHYNDPVTRWTPAEFVQAPPFLTDKQYGVGIPRKQKWYPFISGLQGMFDTFNGTRLPRGVLGSSGHDYRGDIMPLFANLLKKPFTSEQATEAIASANQSELHFLATTKHPVT